MRSKTKIKGPGDNVIFRLKKDESQSVIDWVNNQGNITESLRNLIAMDVIRHGGIVDYGKIIPPGRDEVFLKNLIRNEMNTIDSHRYQQESAHQNDFVHEENKSFAIDPSQYNKVSPGIPLETPKEISVSENFIGGTEIKVETNPNIFEIEKSSNDISNVGQTKNVAPERKVKEESRIVDTTKKTEVDENQYNKISGQSSIKEKTDVKNDKDAEVIRAAASIWKNM